MVIILNDNLKQDSPASTMKTIAIALKTKPLSYLTASQSDLLEEILRDRRLTKAESIKAYRNSDKYLLKKAAYQATHAEFGEVAEIGIAEGDKVKSYYGEDKAIEALGKAIAGAGTIVGFDLHWQLSFILRRCLLAGRKGSFSRGQLFTTFGTATTAMVDIKKTWALSNKEYSALTLEELCVFMGFSSKDLALNVESKAEKTLWVYNLMKGILL